MSTRKCSKKISIVGVVGVPANYGGFETLAENLVKFNSACSFPNSLTVYCSQHCYSGKQSSYHSARLKYIPLKANGAQSTPYDIWSLFSAIFNRHDVILLLGVSGAIVLPLIRMLSSSRIVTNIDGIEWRRDKWRGLVKRFLRFSEQMAVRFSHEVIADNTAIADYVHETYGVTCTVLTYGGNHAVDVDEVPVSELDLPKKYTFSVCRIEPENNVHTILHAFSQQKAMPLVMVGNWNNSDYGRSLREQYRSISHLLLLDPIYDLGKLKTLRFNASLYIHGHKAGGTNPSLVEAMHFAKPILAFDCNFNRATTEDKAIFFANSDELLRLLQSADKLLEGAVGQDMLEIAQRRYTWDVVAREYFALLNRE